MFMFGLGPAFVFLKDPCLTLRQPSGLARCPKSVPAWLGCFLGESRTFRCIWNINFHRACILKVEPNYFQEMYYGPVAGR